jgi:hypothetical protein
MLPVTWVFLHFLNLRLASFHVWGNALPSLVPGGLRGSGCVVDAGRPWRIFQRPCLCDGWRLSRRGGERSAVAGRMTRAEDARIRFGSGRGVSGTGVVARGQDSSWRRADGSWGDAQSAGRPGGEDAPAMSAADGGWSAGHALPKEGILARHGLLAERRWEAGQAVHAAGVDGQLGFVAGGDPAGVHER